MSTLDRQRAEKGRRHFRMGVTEYVERRRAAGTRNLKNSEIIVPCGGTGGWLPRRLSREVRQALRGRAPDALDER